MSFDWLNVPGLSANDAEQLDASEPPPPVSFDFGQFSSDLDNCVSQHDISILKQNPTVSERIGPYSETNEDLQVPLSLSRSQLSKEEARTYLRWYGYIATRKNSKLIRLEDVFHFMANFPLSHSVKERIDHIFKTCRNSLNIGQFFAVLRLISRAIIDNVLPTRRMILHRAPVPRPKSILSAGNEEVYEEIDDSQAGPELKVDFDSFASLLLTGRKKKRLRRKITNYIKKLKKVRFSDNLITFQDQLPTMTDDSSLSDEEAPSLNRPLDLSLPMDQLLKSLAARKKNSALVSRPPSEQVPESQEEKDVLEDMKESLNHFQQIHNADSVAQGGLPTQLPNEEIADHELEPLKPTATGSANHLFRSSQPPIQSVHQEPLQPLKPTATGSANYLFRTSQNPTEHLSQRTHEESTQPLKPTATGSTNNLFLSRQQANAQVEPQPQKATGSGPNYFNPNHLQYSSGVAETPERTPTSTVNSPFHPQPPHFQSMQSAQHGSKSPDHFAQSHNPSPHLPTSYGSGFSNPNLVRPQGTGYGNSSQMTSQDHLRPNFGANNQFQMLMSGSPSPNASTMQINQTSSPTTLNMQHGQMSPMMSTNGGGTYPANNNHSTFHSRPDMTYLHANYTGPPSSSYTGNSYNIQPREYHSFSPSPVPQMPFYSQSPANGSQSEDILGDLKALQARVDQMQHTYKR
ncbi:LANO_0C02014g1_1 [Lachancea nothofagi CBS 11611]|uniref:LANO_0C02014g1_1 n=1 Tax=Lachancea nothofagi CBS 11611 TaxID=1266666 RepID=A0A1G4J4U3_9SACH|nr:LANO_0C02014g1_1 [Lachancea nothofagi CBS 11611]